MINKMCIFCSFAWSGPETAGFCKMKRKLNNKKKNKEGVVGKTFQYFEGIFLNKQSQDKEMKFYKTRSI